MADKVRYATSTIKGDSPTDPFGGVYEIYPRSSGFDAFPFRCRPYSTYDLTDARRRALLVPLTIWRGIEVYWRVRKWRATFTGHAPQTADDHISIIEVPFSYQREFEIGTTYDYTVSDDDPPAIIPTEEHFVHSERELGNYFVNIYGDHYEDDGDGVSFLRWPKDEFSFLIWEDRDDAPWKLPEAIYYPGCGVGHYLPNPFHITLPHTHPTAAGNPRTYTPYGDFTMKFGDGTSIVAEDSVFDDNDLTEHRHCDILLQAIEYWPYRNIAGDPVYDTTTGARLVDPDS